ncbi:hypothetical protein CUMW_126620 [Citrus unshiu]|uniref:Uncharacterized protein n=1 Tax=Citrus unshiu TaxID=55188 RepID=A0A2H5PEB4_CITUN|nr:hypothetical protein CUMW_126620 [Citrus unshiu]
MSRSIGRNRLKLLNFSKDHLVIWLISKFIVIQYSEEDDFMSNLYQKLEKEMHKMVAVFSNETGTTAKAQVVASMYWPEVIKYRGVVSAQSHNEEII